MLRRLFLLLIATPARAQKTLAESLDVAALMARLAAVPERRARFREEKRIAALTVPLVSTGTLLYRRPGRLEKVTEFPVPETLVVDGAQVVLTPGNEPPRVVPPGAVPGLDAMIAAFRAPLAGDLPALQRAFTVAGSGTPDDWLLDLTPTDPAVARLLRQVTVAGAGDQVRRIVVTQVNGDTQAITVEP